VTRLQQLLASLDYRDAERMLAFLARCSRDEDELSGVDDSPSLAAQECYRQALDLAPLGSEQGTPLRLAALAWERFPDGEAFDALRSGRARMADYKRCQTPRCQRGTETPRTMYCPPCKEARKRLQKRLYKRRQGQGQGMAVAARTAQSGGRARVDPVWRSPGGKQPTPTCCPIRGRCEQHEWYDDFARGYRNAWAAGSRGLRRIEWLFGIFGDGSYREGDDTWLSDEDREPDAREGERWLRDNGEKSSLIVKGESDAA